MAEMNRGFRRVLCGVAIWLLFLTMSSCGDRNVSDFTGEESIAGEDILAETESGKVAVADFQYMKMTYPLARMEGHTINGEWMYFFLGDYGKSIPPYTCVSRKRMSDGYLEENYIVSEKPVKEARGQIILADGEGNCYIFWGPGLTAEEEDITYFLTKYGERGELLWHVDYTPEELLDMGEGLYQGTVTADGRVFLYTHGAGGRVFAFGEDGALGDVYAPDMEWLEGVAVGNGGRVYGFGSTRGDFLFTELGGMGETCVCPISHPLEIYSGYEGGICLRTEDSMWRYDPETGETELLWNWKDEYIQLTGGKMERFFYDGEVCRMLFAEQEHVINIWPILTFVSVTFEDHREYPGKQSITLASFYDREYDVDILVKLYNRQSKKYNVEVVIVRDIDSLNLKLLQGKGEDLIDLGGIYGENLAELGAFEDLTAYYEASGAVEWEDILEPVRKACTMRGRNVAVIPSFQISTMLQRENWYEVEDWTVWEFLKKGQEEEALSGQNPLTALMYCMGIRYGEHFVDYENKECHFDSDAFRRILEECGKWDSYPAEEYYANFASGDHLFEEYQMISSVRNMVWDANYIVDRDFSSRMVGYPGWEGGEHELCAKVLFAMNSASENKEGAWDFLEYLLSRELQDMAECWWGNFPVRMDSFEACLSNPYYDPQVMASYDYTEEEPVIPMEKDIAVLRRMVNSAVYRGCIYANNPVWNIVNEEAQMYFAGDSPLDETVRKIQSRVQLYLDEM